MADEALEPRELVVEFRSRLRIAIGQVDRGDDDPVDRSLDVSALLVTRVGLTYSLRSVASALEQSATRARSSFTISATINSPGHFEPWRQIPPS